MSTPHQAILDIAYELYNEVEEITFNKFLDKIVEEDFEKYYEDTLWPMAKMEYQKRLNA